MTRARFNFYLDDDQREGLQVVKERDGITESEQVRRAIRMWLESKNVTVKSARRRASTRRKA